MNLKRQGWAPLGVLLAMLWLPLTGFAQVQLTTVQDTIYSANGTPAQGTVVVNWAAFTTAGGSAVAAGSTAVTLGPGGALSIALAPNAGGTPTGSYYTAVFHLSDGTTSRQYWVVPAGSGPVKLAGIENQVLPTSVAVQTVSKSYVDSAIAKAVTGVAPDDMSTPFVIKAGSAMSGPLVLQTDPVNPQEAATKNYVDVNIAAAAGGLTGKVSTQATTNQNVTQSAGTQLEVNSLNGVLDATGFATGNGNNGFANALASTGCTNGCELRAAQSYLGNEGVPTGSIPSNGHVVDRRGGVNAEFFVNPLGVGNGSSIASSLTTLTTRTAQQAVAARPGIVGPNAYVLALTHNALTGGSNQYPLGLGALPYAKSNYGVLSLTGNYNTQGQHVQSGNVVNCYSVGDCLAGGQYIVSSGGYRDSADEGTHPFDLQVVESPDVFQGTCATNCTTGATALVVTPTAFGGTQGDGRFLMDKNPAKVMSTGAITGLANGILPAVTFSGTNFPTSVFLQTSLAALAQAGNLQPGTITMPIATSGVPAGFATSTSALPVTSGVACISDFAGATVFQNFETVVYKVVDGTHLQLTFNKVHAAGAAVAVGGLCGYGLEEKVDTQGQVRQVFPVVGSTSATQLYYAGAGTPVVGRMGLISTSGYLNVSLPISAARRTGGVVSLTLGTSLPYDLNGLQLTVTGVADASYNGTFTVTTTGSNTLTYASAGSDGTSTGGQVGAVTGGYALYPMAEVLSVYNVATASVDGTMTLAPNNVAWAAGDPVEQPHYHQQIVNADTEFITQYVPRPIQYSSAGKMYQGQLGPGSRGWQITNGVPASNYLGGGGTHQPPDSAFVSAGVWRRAFEMDAGQDAALLIHCNFHSCSRWDSAYSVLLLDSAHGQDFLNFDPNSDTATWNLYGTTYSFSPTSFNAGTINAGTINAGAINGATLGGATLNGATVNGATISGSTLNTPTLAGSVSEASGSSGGTVFSIVNTSGSGSQYNIEVAGSGAPSFANNGLIYHDVTFNRYPFWYSNGSNAGIWAQAAGIFGWSSNASDPRGDGASGLDTGLFRLKAGYVCASASPLNASCNGTMGAGLFHEALTTPASSSAACTPGDFTDDANFHYVCVAANTWKRAALSSF